jgi:hypothetical protein
MDGTVATIAAYGKWSGSQISTCDFGIATLTGSVVVLQPGPGTVVKPLTMFASGAAKSRAKRITWDIAGTVLVKDPGDPRAFLGNIWTGMSDIYNSINSDDTLNGTAAIAYMSRISRPTGAFLSDGTTDWAFIEFNIKAEEI